MAVTCLAALLVLAPGSASHVPPPTPLDAPTLQACHFVPDPRLNASFSCGDQNAPPAFVNVPISFQVNVSDATDNNMTVIFYFDYYQYNSTGPPTVNTNTSSRIMNVSAPALGSVVPVNTTWTYVAISTFPNGAYWVNISVFNESGGFDPSAGSTGPFPLTVNQNSAPFIDGLLSVNSVTQGISYQNPVIPVLYENVSIGDPDADPITVTWFWGDGTVTINTTGPLTARLELHVPHQYAASQFPLNESPRTVDILIWVWIDDGLGHNVSYNSTAEFYINFDAAPSVRIERLFSATSKDQTPVGSVWKVGETMFMVGNVTDPEGDPITAYWDFDNRTDSTGIGDPTRNRDANGTTASHVYTAPGIYNITLWATDGDKEFCRDTNCTLFYTHWQNQSIPITVRFNLPPFVTISNVSTQVGTPTLLLGQVYDQDGDNMTVTWVFGDGSPNATNVTGSSPRGNPKVFPVAQEHVYSEVGSYNFSLYVSDGNVTVNQTQTVFVQSFNQPPVLLAGHVSRLNGTSAGNNTFRINETVVVTAMVYDPENDTLNVSIDWGDGVTANQIIDPKTASNCALDNLSRNICPVSFSHIYGSIGSSGIRNYTVLVTVTDNKVYMHYNSATGKWETLNHTAQLPLVVFITDLHTVGPTPWTWWDYSTLSLVLGIPGFLIARFAWKVRRERMEE